jgi:hypothetical protein
MEEARQKLKEKLGRDPLAEELANDQAFQAGKIGLSKVVGLDPADKYAKSLMDGLQKEAPKKEPTEEEKRRAGILAKHGQLPADNPPASSIPQTQRPPSVGAGASGQAQAPPSQAVTAPPPQPSPAAPISGVNDEVINDLEDLEPKDRPGQYINKKRDIWVGDDKEKGRGVEVFPNPIGIKPGIYDADSGKLLSKDDYSLEKPTPDELKAKQEKARLVREGKTPVEAQAQMDKEAAVKVQKSIGQGYTEKMKLQMDILNSQHQHDPNWSEEKAAEEAGLFLKKEEEAELTTKQLNERRLFESTATPEQALASLSPEMRADLEAEAKFATLTGKSMPLGFSGQPLLRSAYLLVEGDFKRQLGDDGGASLYADYQAGKAGLQKVKSVRSIVGSFENAFQLDLENARKASSQVKRGDVQKYNTLDQFLSANLSDQPKLAAYRVAVQTVVNQYSQLISSSVSGGGSGSTDAARSDAHDLLDKAFASGAFDSALDMMEREAKNRIAGIDKQIDEGKRDLAATFKAVPYVPISSRFDPKTNKLQTAPPPGTKSAGSADKAPDLSGVSTQDLVKKLQQQLQQAK